MRDERPPSLSEHAPLVNTVRILEARQRDVAANVAPDPLFFMTLQQAFLFQHVARVPSGLPMVVLANRALTSAAAVTQMVRRMALRGFVNVEPHPHDGRCRLVTPTAKGYREYEHVFSSAVQQDQRWSGDAAKRVSHDGVVSIERYARAGLELWRLEPEVTGRRYGTG